MVPAVLVKQGPQRHIWGVDKAQLCGPTVPMGTQHSQLCMTASQGGKVQQTDQYLNPTFWPAFQSVDHYAMGAGKPTVFCFNWSKLSASVPFLEQPLSICLISFNLILQQDN